MSFEETKSRLETAGQAHILQFWSELSFDERHAFLTELSQLEPEELKEHCRRAADCANSQSTSQDRLDQRMEPVPPEFIGSVRKTDEKSLIAWEDEGFLQISKSKVAVLLLAGGQGTRLGVPYPKGMYSVGLPSGKTLYQIQAERIQKVQQLAEQKHGSKCTVPWYIMTSEFTLEPTERFFKENHFFGLNPSDVFMFEQRMIPAVTFDGKVILEKKSKIATAPDGNGGLYQALVDNKVLEDMEKRGVVEKAYPAEPVGVVCRVDGVYQVVEYSEIQPETAELRGPGGELLYSAGNICNHFFTRDFLKDITENFRGQLKQHVALKKVPFVDKEGNQVKPTKPNGIKMEKFVFDVFQFSRKFVAFEVLREEEFSPLKNADGAPLDTPTTARRSLLAQHYRWALAAGASFENSSGEPIPPKHSLARDEDPPAVCEISPLVSYFGEGLESVLKQKAIRSPLTLDGKMT
ncbi:UDP-N-acetylhexosamine pyrophosphorylase-like protein 1 isoform X3 [Sardina pilchardus]|uniref:UDP-N-acetylhexosamine pyrophosphorylase-like protein 1 isoform X3 n=1 Tax=Sardina pilchardus TaxID=27697 RepID=UPI002E10049A